MASYGFQTNQDQLCKTEMAEEHKKKLKDNLDSIVNGLENVEDIVQHLLKLRLITQIQADDVLSERSRHNKVRELVLRILPRRSEAAFYSFLESLQSTHANLHIYNLLKDDSMPCISDCDIQRLFGIQENYQRNLYEFHKRNLRKLSQKSPHYIEMAKYVTVGIHPFKYRAEDRHGTMEYSLTPIKDELDSVTVERLFSIMPKFDNKDDLRTVLMIGVPGIGKTMMSYYLLQQIVELEVFRETFNLVFFLKFRELNEIQHEISFQDLLLDCCSPTVQTKDRELITEFMDQYESNTLFILDGYDEFQGLGCQINTTNRSPFSNVQQKEMPQRLLHNLIYGAIRPKSKVFVTSRPHCVSLLTGSYDRLVELNCLDDHQQKQMVSNELCESPELQEYVWNHLKEHKEIKSLCSVPAHLKDFLQAIKYFSKNGSLDMKLYIPCTKSALLFLLETNLLLKHDRALEANLIHMELLDKDILREKRETVQKYAQLARIGLLSSRVTYIFSREDLKSNGLTEDEAQGGILGGYLTCMAEKAKEVGKTYFAFPHLTYQEHLCSLDLLREKILSMEKNTVLKDSANQEQCQSQNNPDIGNELIYCRGTMEQSIWKERTPKVPPTKPEEGHFVLDTLPGLNVLTHDGKRHRETETVDSWPKAVDHQVNSMHTENLDTLVQSNTGSMDMIVLLSLGTMGDTCCAELFNSVYPETNPTQYGQVAVQLLRAIWSSARRHHPGGDLFCIEGLHESCHYESLPDELASILANPLNALNLLDTILSPKDCQSVGKFLSALDDVCYDTVMVKGNISTQGLQSILSANAAYRELILCVHDLGRLEWKILSEFLSTNMTLKTLILSNHQCLVHDEICLLQVKHNTSIQCLGFLQGQVDNQSLEQVSLSLHAFQGLQALNLSNNKLGTYGRQGKSKLGALHGLPNLKYLTMDKCGLESPDMKILSDVVIQCRLKWLDVSHNALNDDGTGRLSKCLSDPQTQLVGLGLLDCNFGLEGAEAVCRSLHNNHTLKILGLSQNGIGDDAPVVVKMLECNRILEQVDLEDCEFSTDQCCDILASLAKHSSMKWFSLSHNDLSCDASLFQVGEALGASNLHLEALCLSKCGLTDKTMEGIIANIQMNSHLKLLNLSDNESVSAKTVVSIIEKTSIQHLGLSRCPMGAEGLQKIGQAVVNSKHIVSIMVGYGDLNEETDLEGFLQELGQYPDGGPLKYLWLYTSRPAVAAHIARLEEDLNRRVKIGIVKDAIAFFMASGMCWSALPSDIALWLSNASFHC